MSGRKRTALILLSLTVIAALVAGVIIYRGEMLSYIIKDSMARLARTERLEEVELAATTVSSEDFFADPRVTVDQSLMLVNSDRLLDSAFSPDITDYNETGVMMNSCITKAYSELADEVRERFDENLYVMSAYRTDEEQLAAISEEGDAAQELGASEHQAGLALDVYVRYYAGEGFLKHDAGRWVNSNCQDYGFIIRYPYYGKSKTGISYEPWHIRYVGLPHSLIMSGNSLTLEEYVEGLEPGMAYSFGNFIIIRQTGNLFTVPESFVSAVCSPDNTGYYITTFKL